MVLKETKGDLEAVKQIRNFSPIASQHLNFGGRYEFNREIVPIDIEKMLKMMDKIELNASKKKKNKR